MKDASLLARIYRLKLLVVGALLIVLGLVTKLLADWLEGQAADHLIVAVLQALSDVLVVTGGFGIAVDFFTGRDKEAADTERTRTVLKELTPDFADAVVRGFAAAPEDLERVATPALLDQIATNVMGLRLGDQKFAEEIYLDVRDQAIRAAERWEDVEVSIRLSTAVERSTTGTPLFDVLIEWEYTTVPSHGVRRFACVSDREEFKELTGDIPSTSTWFMTPRPGMEASSRDAFELLYFAVDGEERPIRRSERKSGQTYSVSIGDDTIASGRPVRIKHIYRTVTSQSGHYLFVELPQPTKDLSLRLDYTETEISRLTVMDLVSSSHRPDIMQMPTQVDARVLSVDLRGWLLPRAGFSFVWSLASEDHQSLVEASSARARSDRS